MSDSIDLTDAVLPKETQPATNETSTETPEGKTFTQDDLDRIVSERVNRERGKYADYETLKTRAADYDAVLARAEAAEARIAEVEREALKSRISAETGVPAAMLTGDSEESMRAAAELLLSWKGTPTPTAPAQRQVLQSGSAKSPEVLSKQERAAQALRLLKG